MRVGCEGDGGRELRNEASVFVGDGFGTSLGITLRALTLFSSHRINMLAAPTTHKLEPHKLKEEERGGGENL